MRPRGTATTAALATTPSCWTERPNSAAIPPVNGANENQMTKPRLNIAVARIRFRYFPYSRSVGFTAPHPPRNGPERPDGDGRRTDRSRFRTGLTGSTGLRRRRNRNQEADPNQIGRTSCFSRYIDTS
jgi:hypothetical protein